MSRSISFILAYFLVYTSVMAQAVGQVLPPWQTGYLDIHHINTGHGDAAFYIFPDGTTMLLDAGESLPFAKNSFDRVLLDAPCSGTGTLRRNPEIRWRLTPSDFSAFAANQKRFLANAAEVVKPGGRLVYSTCSVERDENEDVIPVLDERFRLLDSVRTWPQREGADGFFIAVFEKEQD